jgi:hypothetical protein
MHARTRRLLLAFAFASLPSAGFLSHAQSIPSSRATPALQVELTALNRSVAEPEFFRAFNQLIAATPIGDLRSYMRWQLRHANALHARVSESVLVRARCAHGQQSGLQGLVSGEFGQISSR